MCCACWDSDIRQLQCYTSFTLTHFVKKRTISVYQVLCHVGDFLIFSQDIPPPRSHYLIFRPDVAGGKVSPVLVLCATAVRFVGITVRDGRSVVKIRMSHELYG